MYALLFVCVCVRVTSEPFHLIVCYDYLRFAMNECDGRTKENVTVHYGRPILFVCAATAKSASV